MKRCNRCPGDNDSSYACCEPCRKKAREYMRAMSATRRAAGLCVQCGGDIEPGRDTKRCQACATHENEAPRNVPITGSEQATCAYTECGRLFLRLKGAFRPRRYCGKRCAKKAWDKRFCYCTEKKDENGKCPHGCPPEADPKYLAHIDARIREQEAHRKREDSWFITPEERRRVNAAIDKFDKFSRHNRMQSRRAANRRYRVGAVK